ncbi:MAG: HAMP domain-containing sensor histidine kinase [Kofleriaceae bacterium]
MRRRGGARADRRRTWIAGGVVAGIVGSLLLGWYVAGAADASARARAATRRAAEETATRLATIADELRRDLDDLLRRESQRPYYHYSSLFRDPQSESTGLSLSPSPLAKGPSEPLVAEHFQLGARGALTLPTLNDDIPELSDAARSDAHRVFRAQLAAVAGALRSRALHDSATLVAALDEPAAPVQGQLEEPGDKLGTKRKPVARVKTARKPLSKQVQRVDPDIYAQNMEPAAVYRNIVSQKTKVAPQLSVPVPVPSEQTLRALDQGQVNIVTSPLAWHTLTVGDAPRLLALREVATPDGPLVQGLALDRDALARWLADREAEDDVRLVLATPARAGALREPVVEGWALEATPAAGALAAAAARAEAIERGFLLRFGGVAVLATLAGAFVVLLVAGAERLARERSQFAAAAAHELRTPLAGLQLYGDMLAEGLGDPKKAAAYARRLSEEAARLGRVVSNVLGFSQLERGNLTLAPAEADLIPVVRELVASAEPALDRLGVTVEVVMPASLTARFDRDAVVRIVANLLDNAEKYGRGAEDRSITLGARADAAAGEVEVFVCDRGPGVDADTERRLFRPFSRGGAADLPAGLGLGLALSRSLAAAMGGSLAYRRRDGQTEFLLRLPAGAQA